MHTTEFEVDGHAIRIEYELGEIVWGATLADSFSSISVTRVWLDGQLMEV